MSGMSIPGITTMPNMPNMPNLAMFGGVRGVNPMAMFGVSALPVNLDSALLGSESHNQRKQNVLDMPINHVALPTVFKGVHTTVQEPL